MPAPQVAELTFYYTSITQAIDPPLISKAEANALQAYEQLNQFLAVGNPGIVAAFADSLDQASVEQLEAIAQRLQAIRKARENDALNPALSRVGRCLGHSSNRHHSHRWVERSLAPHPRLFSGVAPFARDYRDRPPIDGTAWANGALVGRVEQLLCRDRVSQYRHLPGFEFDDRSTAIASTSSLLSQPRATRQTCPID